MKHKPNIDLRGLAETLIELSIISTQSELSSLAGKQLSWTSSTLARNRNPSIDALTHLYVNISDILFDTKEYAISVADQEDAESYLVAAADLKNITELLWGEIEERCQNA
ncbi:hypothetical protein [Magnetovibrio blakemorei]|nr:hypothetical protein [Magnetovibrio blakemorei]